MIPSLQLYSKLKYPASSHRHGFYPTLLTKHQGRQLSEAEEDVSKELLRAVDMMPLAVTLLGQLAQRGTPVTELLDAHSKGMR